LNGYDGGQTRCNNRSAIKVEIPRCCDVQFDPSRCSPALLRHHTHCFIAQYTAWHSLTSATGALAYLPK
jgi:hypothetical protein